jgi:hypothetical protein
MGANLSCPSGFEPGILLTCHAECPPEFKYVQEPGSTIGPPNEKCVYRSNNSLSVRLNPLPQLNTGVPIPSSFVEERNRVLAEFETIKGTAASEAVKAKEADTTRYGYEREYEKIQSEYAAWKESTSAQEKLREVKNSLKPFRPPTAPSSDLEKQRKEITELAKRNLFFVQAALFLVVLAMLSYLVFSLDTANLIAFGLLCVGIAMGFFLRR